MKREPEERETGSARQSVRSILQKLVVGFCVLSMTGVAAYAVLFVLSLGI